MKTLKTTTLLFVSMLTLSMVSCKKEELIKKPKADGKISKEQAAQLQSLYVKTTLDMQNMVMSELIHNSEIFRIEDFGGGCATKVKDTIGGLFVTTYDFGTNCVGSDGRIYSGSIVVTRNTKDLKSAGAYFEAVATNFQIDTIIASGTARFDSYGLNGSGNFNGKVTTSMSVNKSTGSLVGYEIDGTNTFDIERFDPDPNIQDDEIIEITGGGSGTIPASGLSFTQTIVSALKVKTAQGCNYPVEGVLLIETNTLPDRTIDYGTGRCDKEIYVTENGVTTTEYLD